MRADMLGLHSISAVGVAESLSAVGADEDYSRRVNELLGRAHADLEEALERLGDEDGNRAQSQRDVASAFNRQLGIVWGLLRTT
jgi:hypothetical protein